MTALAHNQHAERKRSDAVENYLKAIYSLQDRGEEPVSTNHLAERLGVGAAAASGMVRRLAELELVRHEPYHGVSLTREGERAALKTIRTHRLLELFLTQVLEVPWDRVHQEAEVLEHHISPELEELIARKLGDPTTDPHGDPIPSADLRVERSDTAPLDSLSVGDRARFVRISDAEPEMLRYLSERGIAPGDELEVAARQPFGGPLTVRFGDSEHAIGGRLARAMRVAFAG